MFAQITSGYAYFAIVVLLTLGLYGMIAKRNLLKKLVGMTIFQTAIFLFFIHGAAKLGGSVPVIDEKMGDDPALYVNPLPHVIVLTAIVVGVALTGVALALLIAIHREHRTLDEDAILERLR